MAAQSHEIQQVIHIHRQAPPKPAEGAACNGCGLCCLTEPCPLGIVLSGRRTGACVAVRWSDTDSQYRCGAVIEPDAILLAALHPALHWLAPVLSWPLERLARRWIAAGLGCDSCLQPLPIPPLDDNGRHD